MINYELLRRAFNVTSSEGRERVLRAAASLSVLPKSCPAFFPIHCVLFVLTRKTIRCFHFILFLFLFFLFLSFFSFSSFFFFLIKLASAPVGVPIALDSAYDACIFSLIRDTEVEYKINLLR